MSKVSNSGRKKLIWLSPSSEKRATSKSSKSKIKGR